MYATLLESGDKYVYTQYMASAPHARSVHAPSMQPVHFFVLFQTNVGYTH